MIKTQEKLNLFRVKLCDTRLGPSRWLRAHGYSNSLVARYMGSGWLVSPSAVGGCGSQPGGGERMSLYVVGRFALSRQGHEHYLPSAAHPKARASVVLGVA
ncbi:hypothetical protein NMQ14_07310 [Methyloversatilis sp. XJ19-13]|uniref:hypothetical protein n=1 Tax=Methyloversatilis sp. XJ19-13 TaxID=2963430 RepID=UPI00211C696D|nr:hypothetical protein [Methyloversatilis sp. XJ19-13]MCQ9374051.1 hypothetical protein [Methyloversatilis sp. XJ19-13]